MSHVITAQATISACSDRPASVGIGPQGRNVSLVPTVKFVPFVGNVKLKSVGGGGGGGPSKGGMPVLARGSGPISASRLLQPRYLGYVLTLAVWILDVDGGRKPCPPINPKKEKKEECGNSPMGLTKKRYISSQLLDVWKKRSLSPQLVTSQNLRENGRKKGPDVTVHQPAAAAAESGSAVLSFSVDSFRLAGLQPELSKTLGKRKTVSWFLSGGASNIK